MKLNEKIQEHRKEILHLAGKYGAQNVRIFGSAARGDSRADSDLDLWVDLESGRSLLDLGGLLMDLQELLGCRVDVVWNAIRNDLPELKRKIKVLLQKKD